MLLEAEECHAGNRDVKPNQFLPAMPYDEFRPEAERPADLAFKEKPAKPPIEDKFVGKLVSFNYAMETKGGVKFEEGELVKIRILAQDGLVDDRRRGEAHQERQHQPRDHGWLETLKRRRSLSHKHGNRFCIHIVSPDNVDNRFPTVVARCGRVVKLTMTTKGRNTHDDDATCPDCAPFRPEELT